MASLSTAAFMGCPGDEGFLWDKGVVIRDTIKGTP